MEDIKKCVGKVQHFWLPTTGKGLQSYSCPMCGQLVYWSDTSLEWIKPGTSGDKPIPGNNSKNVNTRTGIEGKTIEVVKKGRLVDGKIVPFKKVKK